MRIWCDRASSESTSRLVYCGNSWVRRYGAVQGGHHLPMYSGCMTTSDGLLFEEEGSAVEKGSGQETGGRPTLAARMRPTSLDEVVDPPALLVEGGVIRSSLEKGYLPSIIFYGPPGTGKTTLAELVVAATHYVMERVSAATTGIADVKAAVSRARERAKMGQGTALFIDEIHRFNRTQQDVVLPSVEEGIIRLLGATTENPGFAINRALLSRVRLIPTATLTKAGCKDLLQRAMKDPHRGLGSQGVSLSDDVEKIFVDAACGDARVLLDSVEMAVMAATARGSDSVDAALARDAVGSIVRGGDGDTDTHYWTVSALIKSVRASDVDAGLFWLARMLDGGADPVFIARRLVLLASEDIGVADNDALATAVSAMTAVLAIGMPEGYLPLAHTVVALAQAPKSNAVYTAYRSALEDAVSVPPDPVPLHLRNGATSIERALGYGKGYVYPHDAKPSDIPLPYRPERYLSHTYWKGIPSSDPR